MANNEQVNYKLGYSIVDIRVVELDGHKFIVSSLANNYDDGFSNKGGAGISIIHSPGCSCHNKNSGDN